MYWSAGYACAAGGFAIPVIAAALPTDLWGVIADTLFASAFLFFGQALLQRWRPGWLLITRLLLWGGSILLCSFAIAIDHLSLELAASDFGCFLLIGVPMVAGLSRLDNIADRALFGAVTLVALDNLVRGSTMSWTLSEGAFLSTDYAFLMQALACMFGLFMGLAALAATVLDIIARYRDDAHIDPLTRLFNRRGFDEAVYLLVRKGRTGGSVVTCDIDHFKGINDRFGHATGDRVIAALARIIRDLAPQEAIAARFGGEEFVVYLPESDAARAARFANDVRLYFADDVPAQVQVESVLTASFGLSAVQADDFSLHDAISRADLALYEAKHAGRNCVRVRRALAPSDQTAPAMMPQGRRILP
jgi:diguanylate cyclase (GGDEF)-like protein